MNILFFHRWTGVRGGGAESHLKAIMKNLPSKHTLYLLTREGEEIPLLKKEFPNVKIFTVSRNLFENDNSYENVLLLYTHTLIYMFKAFLKLTYLLITKKIKVDVISIHFATEAVIAYILRAFTGIPYVFILEGYTNWEANEARRADEAISISHYISRKCLSRYGYYPDVIYIGESRFSMIPRSKILKKQKSKTKKVLTLCRFEPRKNLKTAVRTANYVVNVLNRKDVVFEFGGTGIMEEEIKDATQQYKLDKNLKLLGYVPDKDLIDLYQESYIYFLPTFEEGFGIVYTEAMKSGAVIVATRNTATPEVVDDVGILVDDPYNYKEMARSIVQLVDDQDLWLEKAFQGLERAKQFTWEHLIPKYEKKYAKAAGITEGS